MKNLSDVKQEPDKKPRKKRKLLNYLLYVTSIVTVILCMIFGLSSSAIPMAHIFLSGTKMIENSIGISNYSATNYSKSDDFQLDLTKKKFINLWRNHYEKGIPVKPTKFFPTCDQYIKSLKDDRSKYQLIAMYDPGNCAEVPNTHVQVFKNLSLQKESKEKIVSPIVNELTDLCLRANGTLGDPNWRLCYGMPKLYHFARWVQQRYQYSVNYTYAMDELGKECFDKQVSLLFMVMNMNHNGGPRKVMNNLLNGFRLIGKPYVVNARQLDFFDYLFSLDPHHGYFMNYMEEAEAKKFYIGPTVVYSQFEAERITAPVKKYSHVVGASKRALMSQQYFPGMPLQPNNSVLIPTGIDEDIFAPSNSSRNSALIYIKSGCSRTVVDQLKKMIKLKITEIIYGTYNETYFRKALGTATYGIVCDGAETQGIAIEEMMALDVPLFVTNSESVPHFSDEVGVIWSKDRSLNTTFTKFVENVNKKIYRPRKWIIKHLGIVNSVINTLKQFCGLPNQWNPWKKAI